MVFVATKTRLKDVPRLTDGFPRPRGFQTSLPGWVLRGCTLLAPVPPPLRRATAHRREFRGHWMVPRIFGWKIWLKVGCL